MSSRASEQGTGTAGPRRSCGRGPHASPPPPTHCHPAAWRVEVPFLTEGPGPFGDPSGPAGSLHRSHTGEPAGKARPAGAGQAPGLPSTPHRAPWDQEAKAPHLAGTRPRGTGPVPLCSAAPPGWAQVSRWPALEAARQAQLLGCFLRTALQEKGSARAQWPRTCLRGILTPRTPPGRVPASARARSSLGPGGPRTGRCQLREAPDASSALTRPAL